MIRAFASGTGGIGLDPGPHDTKNVKNGTKNTLLAWRSSFIKASTGISSPKKINSVMGIQLLRWWVVKGSLVLSLEIRVWWLQYPYSGLIWDVPVSQRRNTIRTYNIHGMTNYIIPQRILEDAQNTHFPSGKVKKSHLFFSVNFYIPSRTLPFSIANIKCRCPNVLDHNNCWRNHWPTCHQ